MLCCQILEFSGMLVTLLLNFFALCWTVSFADVFSCAVVVVVMVVVISGRFGC